MNTNLYLHAANTLARLQRGEGKWVSLFTQTRKWQLVTSMSKYLQKWEEARCFFTFPPLHSITKIQIKDKTMASSSLPVVTAFGHLSPSGNTNNNGSYLPYAQVSRTPLSSRELCLFPSWRASPICQNWGNRTWKSPREWGYRTTSFRSLNGKENLPCHYLVSSKGQFYDTEARSLVMTCIHAKIMM